MPIIKLNPGYRPPHWLESLIFHIGYPVVRAYGHVITKISGMDRLPIFLRYGAPLARAELRYKNNVDNTPSRGY